MLDNRGLLENSGLESLRDRATVLFEGRKVAARKEQRQSLEQLVASLNSVIGMADADLLPQLVVTDEEGVILYTFSNAVKESLQGVSLAEESVGRNVAALALKQGRTVNAWRSKLELLEGIVLAVPLIKDDELLGCVGVLGISKVNSRYIGFIDSIIQTAVSSGIQVLKARESVNELYLLKEFLGRVNYHKTALIAVDLNLHVVQVNPIAVEMLAIKEDKIIGQAISELITSPLEFDRKGQIRKLVFSTPKKMNVNTKIVPIFDEYNEAAGWILELEPAVDKKKGGEANRPDGFRFSDLIGDSAIMKKTVKLARVTARSSSNVLITGESGTGKELFAQAIHNGSSRPNGPFVAINCSAIPRELIETELFGYVEGAFTGSRKGGMKGKFQLADHGSLFLDEIGDMPLELQPKLLRVLQERQVSPVGGSKPIPVDIRIISATNQDLEQLVEEGKFRKDLYYRLNVIHLELPSLRERGDDILLLSDFFLQIYNARLNKSVQGFTEAARERLLEYHWPGNVRELENVIECVVNLVDGGWVDEGDLPQSLTRGSHAKKGTKKSKKSLMEDDEVLPLEEVEKICIIKALNVFNGNVTEAANALQIGRTTLYRKIDRYKLSKHVRR